MQKPVDSYVCGINTRSGVHLFCQIYFSSNKGVPDSDRNLFIMRKVNMT